MAENDEMKKMFEIRSRLKIQDQGNRNKNIKNNPTLKLWNFWNFFQKIFFISKLFESPIFYGNHNYDASEIIINFSLWAI